MNFKKITPIYFTLLVIEIVLIFISFYYILINNNNGNALIGTIAFIGALINLLLIVIERIIADKIGENNKQLWIFEISIIFFVAYFLYKNGLSIG